MRTTKIICDRCDALMDQGARDWVVCTFTAKGRFADKPISTEVMDFCPKCSEDIVGLVKEKEVAEALQYYLDNRYGNEP